MKPTRLEKKLIVAFSEMEIIDCHEHLSPEDVRTAMGADVFTLFSHYTHADLCVAGMKEDDYQGLFKREVPLEKRWKTFAPYWEKIRWTSYARAALLAAEKFYGASDINDDTYRDISEAIREANTPGLYERVLREACNIKVSLTQCGRTDTGSDLLVPLMPLHYEMETWEALSHPPFEPTACIDTLDDYLEAIRRYVVRV